MQVHTIVQEDSSLVVTTVEESTKIAGAPPAAAAPGDIVCEVASRSGSWYKGMSLEEIMSHLQVSLSRSGEQKRKMEKGGGW